MWRALGLLLAIVAATSAFAQSSSTTPGAAAPPYASSAIGTMYISTCQVVVNSSSPTSTFCPIGTDPKSATSRTYPPNTLSVGKAFYLIGGGIYTVPGGNTLSADIKINVGAANVMSVTTPSAPAATNQGVEFWALCSVRTPTTINCTGSFKFVVNVLSSSVAPVSFSQTTTFDPTVANLIDVTGDWNGSVSTQSTTVTQAVLMPLN